MFNCHICGSHESEEKRIDETFIVRGETVLVQHIPAKICKQCGEIIFDVDTAEHIRELLNNSHTPTSRVSIPVYEFA